MSSYEDQFVRIRVHVVFHVLYFRNEVGDPPNYLTVAKVGKKICVVEDFRANVLNTVYFLL